MKNLETGLLAEADLFLFLDYYELTSGKCNLDHGMNQVVTENYFFREIPEHLGGYILFAGLEQTGKAAAKPPQITVFGKSTHL